MYIPNTIARYGIETSDSKSSSSPLYTAPNTPSPSPLHPIAMDENWNLMASDTDEHVVRLESRLFDVREQARAQQNTLDNILQLLQSLPALGDSHIPGNLTTASKAPIPMSEMSDSTSHAQVRGLKPATPNEFDGD